VIEVADGGLRLVDGELRGLIGIGLEDVENPWTTRRLRPAIRLRVTADPASTSPRSLSIDHTDLPFSNVELSTDQDVPSISVSVRVAGDSEPVQATIRALRPQLVIEASPQRLQGFGLQETTLTVSVKSSVDSPSKVRFAADGGDLEPHQIELDAGGFGSVKLRSSGLGTTTVTASALMHESANTQVEFAFPVAFLVASLLGGLVGAAAFVLLTKKASLKVPAWKRLLGGVLAGLVIAVLYTIGISVFGFPIGPRSGEALYFSVSALGAVGGLPLITKLLSPSPQ
jgi:hypothetical protein